MADNDDVTPGNDPEVNAHQTPVVSETEDNDAQHWTSYVDKDGKRRRVHAETYARLEKDGEV